MPSAVSASSGSAASGSAASALVPPIVAAASASAAAGDVASMAGAETPRGTKILQRLPNETENEHKFRCAWESLTQEQTADSAAKCGTPEREDGLRSPLDPLPNKDRIGGPRMWHVTHRPLTTSSRVNKHLNYAHAITDIITHMGRRIFKSLHGRTSPNGSPLTDRLGQPELRDDGSGSSPLPPLPGQNP
jgi:hypothetical protein